MYNRTGIVRAPFRHPEVPVRRPQSVSSKIYKRRAFGIIVSRKEDDRDEDAVNTCSSSSSSSSSSSRNEYDLGGTIALLLQDHRTVSTKSVCNSQYMVTDQH